MLLFPLSIFSFAPPSSLSLLSLPLFLSLSLSLYVSLSAVFFLHALSFSLLLPLLSKNLTPQSLFTHLSQPNSPHHRVKHSKTEAHTHTLPQRLNTHIINKNGGTHNHNINTGKGPWSKALSLKSKPHTKKNTQSLDWAYSTCGQFSVLYCQWFAWGLKRVW